MCYYFCVHDCVFEHTICLKFGVGSSTSSGLESLNTYVKESNGF